MRVETRAMLQFKRPEYAGLAVVLVGSDPASEAYARMKGKAADKAGFIRARSHCPRKRARLSC
jgi:5,10-methylene-tetrahydrofolate dehydrogenase/methenyl tetrahydrofolate cyclohydrolase